LPDVLYLVGNTGDSAVARRVDMLRDGGATVSVAGFRRAGSAAPSLHVDDYYELGQTFDARFAQRIFAIARAAGPIKARMRSRGAPEVIVARNLEMLFLAVRLRGMWGGRPAIVYECLDIHRLMLRQDVIGRSLRRLERHLARKASLLLISSPAFAREYFDTINPLDLPIRLVENKVYGSPSRGQNPALGDGDRGPIRIGWFGALRCRRSLDILDRFAWQMNGNVEVVLRGRPALTEFDDFHGVIAANPFLSYEGPYRNPADLAAIYSDVHLAWAIDYFEEGQNSQWLLPNRIYEGCLNGAIPVALAGTETASFIASKNIGIVLDDTRQDTLLRVLGGTSREALRNLAAAVATTSADEFAGDTGECRALVAAIAGATAPEVHAVEAAA
jgi:succinoglycan biosynthesis protein ExoL